MDYHLLMFKNGKNKQSMKLLIQIIRLISFGKIIGEFD